MGTPLGPKYIPYTYMDPLGAKIRQVSAFLGNGLSGCWVKFCSTLCADMIGNH